MVDEYWPVRLIFSSMSEFNSFPNKPWFSPVCSTVLFKTLREKEKLLVTSNFSFSHSVFYPIEELYAIFIKFEIVVWKLCQFRSVKFVVLERVNYSFADFSITYTIMYCAQEPYP